ncbi:restriction endonuclease subunit S [Empedobacter falsenii]
MVKQGYKQTEIGVIPEDWEVYDIQELINNNAIVGHLDGNHGALYPKSHEFVEDGVPYVGANALIDGKIDFKKVKYLTIERANTFQKGISFPKDLLFAHNATVGPVAYVQDSIEKLILSTTLTYFRCDESKLNSKFLLYEFQAERFVKQYSSVMSQSTRNQVPITAQRKFKIPLPPLAEQEAIAKALSDADAWIESLEQLIAKKRLIKQGAMQTLLTPPSHAEPVEAWEVKKLGDYVKFQTGFPFSSEFFNTKMIGERLIKNRDLRSDDSIFYYSGEFKKDFIVNNEDLLIGMDGDFEPVLWKKGKALLNQRVGRVLKLKEISIQYLAYSLIDKLKEIEESTGSTTVKHLSHSDIENLEYKIPSLSEQERIATILSDMDAEIEALEQKLAKAKQIKQGLMQKLLTGRIRLV